MWTAAGEIGTGRGEHGLVQMRKGGKVRKTKAHMLHKGEQVLTAREAKKYRKGKRRGARG